MNDEQLIDEMVRRLGVELKGLITRIREKQVAATAIELVVREQLWHLGNQALGVLLETLDRRLVADRAVHDHRTRTVMSLFGPLDIGRSRCRKPGGWEYPLDEAMGLVGQRGWTAGVQEAVSLLSCECPFATVADLMERLLAVAISPPSVQQVAEESGQRAEQMLEVDKPCVQLLHGIPDTLIIPIDGADEIIP